jgi:hypothetical protein
VIAVVVAVAVAFLAMGCIALVWPAMIPAQFGARADTADVRTEIRAVYGGFGVATAALLVVGALQHGDVRTGITLAIGVALAGMAVGRVLGMLVERPERVYPNVVFLVAEVVAAAALLVAAARWSEM